VELPFNVVRLRTEASRRFKKVKNAEVMIWKLLTVAEKTWRKLNAPGLLKEVYAGQPFKGGAAVKSKSRGKPPDRIYTPIDGGSGLHRDRATHCIRIGTREFP